MEMQYAKVGEIRSVHGLTLGGLIDALIYHCDKMSRAEQLKALEKYFAYQSSNEQGD